MMLFIRMMMMMMLSMPILFVSANTQLVNSAADTNTAGTFRNALLSVSGTNPVINFLSNFQISATAAYPAPTGYTGTLTISGSGAIITFVVPRAGFNFSLPVSISGLQVFNNSAVPALLFVQGSGGSSLDNVGLGSSGAEGVGVYSSGTFRFNALTIQGVAHTSCMFIKPVSGITNFTLTNSVLGGIGSGCGGSGLDLVPTLGSFGTSFINNTLFAFNTASGLQSSASSLSGLTISNSRFLNNIVDGINFGSVSTITGLTLTGNTFENNENFGVEHSSGGALSLSSSTFTSNRFANNPSGAIFMDSATNVVFTDNGFTDNGVTTKGALSFQASVTNVMIQGGYANTSLYTTPSASAITLASTSTGFQITSDNNGANFVVSYYTNILSAPNPTSHMGMSLTYITGFQLNGDAFNIAGPTINLVVSQINLGLNPSTFSDAPVSGAGLRLAAAASGLVFSQVSISNVLQPVVLQAGASNSNFTINTFSDGSLLPSTSSIINVTGTLSNSFITQNAFNFNTKAIAISLRTISNSVINQNTIKNSTVGIRVTSDSPGTFIWGNTIEGCSISAIQITHTPNPTNGQIGLNTTGGANIIMGNQQGISITGGGIRILANAIAGNLAASLPGINVGTLANPQSGTSPQNPPNLSQATLTPSGVLTVTGNFTNTLTGTSFLLDLYCNPPTGTNVEALRYIGTATIPASATATFTWTVTLVSSACALTQALTATATASAIGRTSDISNAVIIANPTPTPTQTPSPTISVTRSPTISVSTTPTISVSTTRTISVSATPSISVSATPTISVSATPSISVSATPSISVSATPSISVSPSVSPSRSVTRPPGCGNGVVTAPEQCDLGSALKPQWIKQCCNFESCQFRLADQACGKRLGPCYSLPRCNAVGHCRPSHIVPGKRCNHNTKRCNTLGQCVLPLHSRP